MTTAMAPVHPAEPRTRAAAGSVAEALGAATDALTAAGVDTPRLDAELLLSEATGRDRAALAADPDAPVTGMEGRRFGEMVRRRARREPVAYILGRRGFRRLELLADPRALIPRPETELLVDVALELRPESMLDIGTGSGAVALAVADELPGCRVVGTDTAPSALELARENARQTGLANRVELRLGSVPDREDFDLVVANLPYVADREEAALAPEISRFEPREALFAGPAGLEAFRAVIPSVRAPALALEIGAGQAEAVAGLMRESGFGEIETRPDLAGHERVLVGRR
jgi:release factor glutamine methyltransferase